MEGSKRVTSERGKIRRRKKNEREKWKKERSFAVGFGWDNVMVLARIYTVSVHVPSKILAQSHQESARFSIDNKKEKKRHRKKPLKIQGKKGKADTDPAATLRMHLDPRLGENEEKMKKER